MIMHSAVERNEAYFKSVFENFLEETRKNTKNALVSS
jgi:hypothetical protein